MFRLKFRVLKFKVQHVYLECYSESDTDLTTQFKNLALNQPAEQIDNYFDGFASLAVDGNRDGNWS